MCMCDNVKLVVRERGRKNREKKREELWGDMVYLLLCYFSFAVIIMYHCYTQTKI